MAPRLGDMRVIGRQGGGGGFLHGEFIAGLGERLFRVGDLGFEFGDAGAKLCLLGRVGRGQFLFEIGLEFVAQADEFGDCQGSLPGSAR